MKLFLASLASETLDLVLPLLPDQPSKLKVAYIPTAYDPYLPTVYPWMTEGRSKLVNMGFNVTDYDLKNKTENILRRDLKDFDIIYVEGGNTFYLLNEVKKSGFDNMIKELLENGTLYIGSSAGSMIMSPDLNHLTKLDHPEEVPELTDYTCLGIIKDRIVPHAGRKKYASRHAQIQKEWGDQITFIRDDQAIVVNGDNTDIISNRKL